MIVAMLIVIGFMGAAEVSLQIQQKANLFDTVLKNQALWLGFAERDITKEDSELLKKSAAVLEANFKEFHQRRTYTVFTQEDFNYFYEAMYYPNSKKMDLLKYIGEHENSFRGLEEYLRSEKKCMRAVFADLKLESAQLSICKMLDQKLASYYETKDKENKITPEDYIINLLQCNRHLRILGFYAACASEPGSFISMLINK